MSQGFNSRRHRPRQADESRWARFTWLDEDEDGPFPTDPQVLPYLVRALQGRARLMDRTKGKRFSTLPSPLPTDTDGLHDLIDDLLHRIERLDRTINKQLAPRIRLYIRAMAVRERFPDSRTLNWFRLRLGHYDMLFAEELAAIERGKLVSFGCLPGVLRLQRDHLYGYMGRNHGIVSGLARGDGYATGLDSPTTWLKRNSKRLHEELSFYCCSCEYRSDLDDVDVSGVKGPGELIPMILSVLHCGMSAASIRQVLKASSRLSSLPPFLK